jgi:hypothetical protein
MKKYFLLVTMLATSIYLVAQEDVVITASKKINKETTPQQVIDSLEKRFPNAKAVQYYKTPKDGVYNGWEVTQEDGLDIGEDVEYYTLSFKNSNIKYYGLYNADGTLVMSKLDQSSATLPEAVKTKLKQMAATDYKGWKLVSSSYHKRINHKKNSTYYEVTAAKGSEKKVLHITPEGEIIK